MASTLRNSLLKMVVAVGMDENTGLDAAKQQPPDLPSHQHPLFHTAFEPQVLAGVSANVALFPTNKAKQDTTYPPNFGMSKVKFSSRGRLKAVRGSVVKTSTHSLKRDFNNQASRQGGEGGAGKRNSVILVDDEENEDEEEEELDPPKDRPSSIIRRFASRNRSFRPTDFARRNSRTQMMQVKPTDLPMEMDQLANLVTLCFPDGAFVHPPTSLPADVILFLVLTDLQGNKSYAASLIYYLPYQATKDVDQDLQWHLSCGPATQDSQLCYVPMAVVLISQYPYFMLLKQCLSSIAVRLKESRDDMQHVLKESALHLCSVAVPAAGCNIGIEFTFNQTQLNLLPAMFPGQPVINIQSNLLFQFLSREVILKVIGCLLTQQTVVFISASYAMLTTVIQTFLHLLYPFVWEFTYVPVLPWILLELLEAPGTFIMGCHCKHKQQIRKIDTLVLVDIDEGELERCGPMFIPALPQEAVDTLNSSLRKLQPNKEVWMLNRPCSLSFEDSTALDREFDTQFNHMVFTAFLQLMVDLFRGVLPHIKPEKNFFNREKFLECVPDIDKTFYEQVLNTDMFSTFVKHRLAQKYDAWCALEETSRQVKTKTFFSSYSMEYHRQLSTESVVTKPTLCKSQSSPELLSAPHSNQDVTFFTLPNFVYALNHVYFENCVVEVERKLQECQDPVCKAGYLYLLAHVKAATADHKLEALELFQEVEKLQPTLFPFSDVADIIANLSSSEQDRLKDRDFYRRSDIWSRVKDQQNNPTVIMAFDKIPKGEMDLTSFSEMVQVLEISKNHEAIHRLFKALTLVFSKVVSADVFEEFYRCWKETEMQCRDKRLSVGVDGMEAVLKMSDIIKCSYGMGRLGLTQKRLVFLREGSKKLKDVIQLVDIKSVEKFEQKNIFMGPSQDLRIISKDEKPRTFTASLKARRDVWYMCVSEMWLGQCLANETGDTNVEEQAAHNVMLMEAYARSSENDNVNSFLDLSRGSELLCDFLSRRDRGTMTPRNSKTKQELLHHKVDPSAQNHSERLSVQAVLYTPGNRSGGATTSEMGPKLWCALGSHKKGGVVMYDAATWGPKTEVLQAQDRVSCLLSVAKSQVWAGSFDCYIYVIDIAKRDCVRVLTKHSHMVTGLAKTEFESDGESYSRDRESTVYSCSLNGEVIQWCVSTQVGLKQFSLLNSTDLRLLTFGENLLWCGTRQHISLFSGENEVGKIQYDEELIDPATGAKEKFELDCFVITPNLEVWIGCRTRGIILIYDAERLVMLEPPVGFTCQGISAMTRSKDKIWVGTREGKLFIFDQLTRRLIKWVSAHTDAVRTLSTVGDKYVLSGAGCLDGTVAMWTADI